MTQNAASFAEPAKPTFTFGQDNHFGDGQMLEGGVLFKAKGADRHKRRDVNAFRSKTLEMLKTGEMATVMGCDIIVPGME